MWLLGKTWPIEFGHAMGDSETFTAFENYRKSLIQYCERSIIIIHFDWKKLMKISNETLQVIFKQCERCGFDFLVV